MLCMRTAAHVNRISKFFPFICSFMCEEWVHTSARQDDGSARCSFAVSRRFHSLNPVRRQRLRYRGFVVVVVVVVVPAREQRWFHGRTRSRQQLPIGPGRKMWAMPSPPTGKITTVKVTWPEIATASSGRAKNTQGEHNNTCSDAVRAVHNNCK